MKALPLFVLIFFLLSCNNDETPPLEKIDFIYKPRTSLYTNVSHYFRTDVGEQTGASELDNSYVIEPLTSKSISVTNYLVAIETSSFNKEITASAGFNPDDYLTDADLNMEQQIERYLEQEKSKNLSSARLRATLVDVEYRKEEVENIKISATTNLFETEAGESLNDKFEIFGNPNYHDFLFSYDKQLIGSIQRGWTIGRYLNHRPIASAFLYLILTSTPPELPIETQFIVEMKMAGGAILQDTTEIINLLP